MSNAAAPIASSNIRAGWGESVLARIAPMIRTTMPAELDWKNGASVADLAADLKAVAAAAVAELRRGR